MTHSESHIAKLQLGIWVYNQIDSTPLVNYCWWDLFLAIVGVNGCSPCQLERPFSGEEALKRLDGSPS